MTRPKSFSEIYGQKEVIAALQSYIHQCNLPSVLLFSGPSGTGKTSTAILTSLISNGVDIDKVTDWKEIPYTEFLQGGLMGKADIEELGLRLKKDTFTSFTGKKSFYIVDEAHLLTHSAKGLALTILEDLPEGVHVILCTMDPDKLDKALRTRAVEFVFKEATTRSLLQLASQLIPQEKWDEDDVNELVQLADGSYRAMTHFCERYNQGLTSLQIDPDEHSSYRFNTFQFLKTYLEKEEINVKDCFYILSGDWYSFYIPFQTMMLSLAQWLYGKETEKNWCKMFGDRHRSAFNKLVEAMKEVDKIQDTSLKKIIFINTLLRR